MREDADTSTEAPRSVTSTRLTDEPGPQRFSARIRRDRAMITAMATADRSLSMNALRLHAQGLLASFEVGRAGIVPDGYLAGRGPDAAAAALELCRAGVWTRTDGGYRVISSEALRMAYEVHRQVRKSERRSRTQEQ
jgi:hypothetical protein